MARYLTDLPYNDSTSSLLEPTGVSLFFNITDLFIVAISIVLNILTLVVIFGCKRLHTIPNISIASLACANFSLATACGWNLSLLLKSQSRYRFFEVNYSWMYLVGSFMMCSLCNHLMISVERWMYIAWPYLHQRVVTHRAAAVSVVISWLISLLTCTYILPYCRLKYRDHEAMIFNCLILPCIHFALSTTMFAIYGHIAVITKRQIKAIYKIASLHDANARVDAANRLTSVRQSWKQVRMLVIVFGTYFCLLSPLVFLNIYVCARQIDLSFYESDLPRAVTVCSHLNFLTNFFTYSLQDRQFRHALKRRCMVILSTFTCKKKVHPLDPTQ